MKKGELKNGMAVIVKMNHGNVSDRIVDINQVHGVWCQECRLVGKDQIFPATIESEKEINEYDDGPAKMLAAGDNLMAQLIEPKFV